MNANNIDEILMTNIISTVYAKAQQKKFEQQITKDNNQYVRKTIYFFT